jgi:hypothetical protein
VELVDLARALRDQPDLFGADSAFERALLLDSGRGAGLALNDAGGLSVPPDAHGPFLVLTKR